MPQSPLAELPLLARGPHADSRHGTCLMEATALLAGEPRSDRPRCVHPLLVAVAQIVNDAVSDRARQQLLPLAPRCARTFTDDPRVVEHLVVTCCRSALPLALPIWAPRLRRALREAERRSTAGPAVRRLDNRRLRRAESAIRCAVISLAIGSVTERDELLVGLLEDCLAVIERVHLKADGQALRPAAAPCGGGHWLIADLQPHLDADVEKRRTDRTDQGAGGAYLLLPLPPGY